jgi:hypothetical protein
MMRLSQRNNLSKKPGRVFPSMSSSFNWKLGKGR